MSRISELDLPDRLSPTLPIWGTQLGVALLCLGAAGLVRLIFNALVPGAAPFALLFPAVLVATLFARWRSGAIVLVVGVLYAWYVLLPIDRSFVFADVTQVYTLIIVTVTAISTLAIAEIFRRAARHATEERDRQIADRDLFLREFDHRVKNNFAIVASLLDMQRRRVEPAAAEALSAALQRVDSIARAHRHLYRDSAGPGEVEMHDYLSELCSALADVLVLRGGIELRCRCDRALLPRDRAVSIGLIVNELVTNAAKHAFKGRAAGHIDVLFRTARDGWTVTVADDGIGMTEAEKPDDDGGLGTRLIDAFARQAQGMLVTDTGPHGTRVTLDLSA
ncbi:MAG: sensor histidine kinase [Sphingomonas sp.]